MLPVGCSCREFAEVQHDGDAPEVVVRPLVRVLLNVVPVIASVARAKVQRGRHPPDTSSISKPQGPKSDDSYKIPMARSDQKAWAAGPIGRAPA
eukprot:8675527-Pyramimonas_sp.AAC.1